MPWLSFLPAWRYTRGSDCDDGWRKASSEKTVIVPSFLMPRCLTCLVLATTVSIIHPPVHPSIRRSLAVSSWNARNTPLREYTQRNKQTNKQTTAHTHTSPTHLHTTPYHTSKHMDTQLSWSLPPPPLPLSRCNECRLCRLSLLRCRELPLTAMVTTWP